MYGDDLKVGDTFDWRFKKRRGNAAFETGRLVEKRTNGLMLVMDTGTPTKRVVLDPSEIDYRKVSA